MSAYALPGLFPPLPFFHNDVNISISIGDCSSTLNLEYGSLEKEEKVEYEPRTTILFAETVLSTSCCDSDQIEISVKDGKIDTMQWIQSLTSNAALLLSANAARKRSPRRRNSPPLNPELVERSTSCSAEELAMQFEMSISWNGRQYMVVRSLERMRCMREQLVIELEMMKMKTTAPVPELPLLPDNGGCSNQSFALLQGMLRSHIPTVEIWLNQVFALVPRVNDSVTLTNFILEPVCSLQSAPVLLLKQSTSLPTLLRRSSLASISEDEEEE